MVHRAVLGLAARFSSDLAGALRHFTALRDAVADRPPSAALADALAERSGALRELGQISEAAEEGRRSLAVARELGYPLGEVVAAAHLALTAAAAENLGEAVRLARQAVQVPDGILPSTARWCSVVLTEVLIQADDFAAAGRVCAAALDRARDAGDLWVLPALLSRTVLLDLWAGRTGDAAAHLREVLQIEMRAGDWNGVLNCLNVCGYLSPRPGGPRRPSRRGPRTPRSCRTRTGPGTHGTGKNRCAPPGRRWARPGRGRPRSAARR